MHPFRLPAYEALQLRTIQFAKIKRRRLLWVLAYDWVKKSDVAISEDRKETWLRFGDKKTNGIPGMLPLVLDLPVRFTEPPNKAAKALGVFKHTRGMIPKSSQISQKLNQSVSK